MIQVSERRFLRSGTTVVALSFHNKRGPSSCATTSLTSTTPTLTCSLPFLSSCTETKQHITVTRATVACNSIGGYPVSSSLITGMAFVHLLMTASRTYVQSLAWTAAMHFPIPDPKRSRIAQACSGAVAPDVPSLLTIAPELRNQIYEYLLVEPCPITIENA